MQQQLSEILGQVAPYVIMAAQASCVIFAIAVLAFALRLLIGRFNWLLKLSSRLMMLLGVVFLGYEGVLKVADMPGADNYGFYGHPFWMLAATLLGAGVVFRLISALRPTR